MSKTDKERKEELQAIMSAKTARGGKLGAMTSLIQNPAINPEKQNTLTDLAIGLVLAKRDATDYVLFGIIALGFALLGMLLEYTLLLPLLLGGV